MWVRVNNIVAPYYCLILFFFINMDSHPGELSMDDIYITVLHASDNMV